MASTKCASHTTPKGLQFSLFCNTDTADIIANSNLDSVGAADAEDCMGKCSEHPINPCGGVAFDANTFKCFFKTTNATSVGAVARAGWTLGIANPIQLKSLPTACPNNGQTQTTENGLDFQVFCDQDLRGFDVCTDRAPGCRIHTSTLDECLHYCSTMQAPCTGVAWDAAQKYGFTNCYPKSLSASDFDVERLSVTDGLRCAKALLKYPTDACRSKATGTVIATNKDKFTLNCDEDRPGNNITAQHSDTLDQCIDSCAKHTNPTCVGAVFDAEMARGYQNCHLKSAVGQPLLQMKGYAFASRLIATNETTNGTVTPSDLTANAQSKLPAKNMAWIVGPVIGGIAAIAAILLAVRWWKNRGRKKGNHTHDHETRFGSEINMPPPLSTQKHELDNTQLHVAHELDHEPMHAAPYEPDHKPTHAAPYQPDHKHVHVAQEPGHKPIHAAPNELGQTRRVYEM